MVPTRPDDARPARARGLLWPALDVVVILVFAGLGRMTHYDGVTAGGLLSTAAPFAAAYSIAAAAVLPRRDPSSVWPAGVVLWLGTVVGGLALRALLGGGIAVSFQIVALLTLGAGLLLPRAVAAATRAARAKSIRSPDTAEPHPSAPKEHP